MQVLGSYPSEGDSENLLRRNSKLVRFATRRFMANDLPVPGPAMTRTRGSGAAAIPYATLPVSRPVSQAILFPPFDDILSAVLPRSHANRTIK